MSKIIKRRTGWVRDLPDKRDFPYKALRVENPIAIPPMVDLTLKCSPVEDQGNLGSCTAQALVANMEFLQIKNLDIAYIDLARLFVYYNERKIEGTIHEDAGAMIRNGIKTLQADGVCMESLCPYDVSTFETTPTDAAYKEATSRRITSYHRLETTDDMLHCLADGFPFVFGFTVYSALMSQKTAETGILPMPSWFERAQGGHAAMAVGYDMDKKVFIVRNSWGAAWGVFGYFTMPFGYLEKFGNDFWTLRP